MIHANVFNLVTNPTKNRRFVNAILNYPAEVRVWPGDGPGGDGSKQAGGGDERNSDGTPVDARHVADYLTELNAENSNARSSLGAITAIPEGDRKVRIESERATHMMDAVLAEWVFVVYRKDSGGNYVFTGPYAVQSFATDHIDLTPNRYYDSRALQRPPITLQKFADGHDLADGVQDGSVDVGFHLPISTLPSLRETPGVAVRSFEVGYHYMVFHNTDRLRDVRVRRAIDLAIDRTALSQALAGGTATRSLFPDYSPFFSDGSDLHGDADAAAAKLDAAGWTLHENGKREKDGDELTVNLVAYPHRPGLVVVQPLIAASLTALGITVTTTLIGMDWSETQTILDDRTFDLLLWAQHTLPAGDPLWFLSAFFRTDGANNHANLSSPAVDSAIETLSLAEDHGERVAAAKSAHGMVLDRVPVSNLVTPFWHVGLSGRMADYEPWGADYYVIRADLFPKEAAVADGGDGVEDDSSVGRYGVCFVVLVSFVVSVLSAVL